MDNNPSAPPGAASAKNTVPETKRRRWFWLALVAAVVSVAGAAILYEADRSTTAPAVALESRRVSTAIADLRMMEPTVKVTGTLVARNEVAISASVEGQRLLEVLVDEGDRVEAGQVLARLEGESLRARLRQAEAAVVRARAAVGQQEVARGEAQTNFRRAEAIRNTGAISAQQYDERHAAFRAAERGLEIARAELVSAEAQLAEAQIQLGFTTIRAPAAGIVSERITRAGELPGNEPLFRIIRDGEVEFEAEVPETRLTAIAHGQRVEIHVAGLERVITGRVRLVGTKVDLQSRLGRVRIALPLSADLRPGSFAQATIHLGGREVVSVPEAALLYGEAPGPSVVVVGGNGVVARRAIVSGLHREGYVEVTRGLAAGERVVLAAASYLRDGERVEPVETRIPAEVRR